MIECHLAGHKRNTVKIVYPKQWKAQSQKKEMGGSDCRNSLVINSIEVFYNRDTRLQNILARVQVLAYICNKIATWSSSILRHVSPIWPIQCSVFITIPWQKTVFKHLRAVNDISIEHVCNNKVECYIFFNVLLYNIKSFRKMEYLTSDFFCFLF